MAYCHIPGGNDSALYLRYNPNIFPSSLASPYNPVQVLALLLPSDYNLLEPGSRLDFSRGLRVDVLEGGGVDRD